MISEQHHESEENKNDTNGPSEAHNHKNLVELSAYEQTLLKALRSKPTGLEMWKTVGQANGKHRDITHMLLYTMDICNELEIEYWAEWGTILGVLRHRGVIPWDWDFDISFRTPDF